MPFRIETGDTLTVRCRSHRQTIEERKEIVRQTGELLKNGFAVEDDDPYSSPVLLVNKGFGHNSLGTRFEDRRPCVDHRMLNKVTKIISWPLKTLPQITDALAENQPKLFTSLDLKSGYLQQNLYTETVFKTAFEIENRKSRRKLVPFGLSGAPANVRRLIGTVLRGLSATTCIIYLDDILIYAYNPEHMIVTRKAHNLWDYGRPCARRLLAGQL